MALSVKRYQNVISHNESRYYFYRIDIIQTHKIRVDVQDKSYCSYYYDYNQHRQTVPPPRRIRYN